MDFGDISIASIGGIAGKNSKAEFQAPVRTTKYPREIPPLPWYRKTAPQMAMAGFLPFSAILFIVFIILLIVTAFITVALTYFHLAAEDPKWWWRWIMRDRIPVTLSYIPDCVRGANEQPNCKDLQA
ncbi:transmembrane 9 superfamily member 3-like protein [Tanacetum coccineum]